MLKKIAITLSCILSLLEAENIRADVQAVTTQGSAGTYTFSVTLKSVETGCEQYANWWEVLSEKGELLYRRILVHSHPTTQPFTRSGATVKLAKDDIVYVRAHMHKQGYVGDVFIGSVAKGFKLLDTNITFSKEIEMHKPLPSGCLY